MSAPRPPRPWSLRRRLELWLAVLVAALWLAAATVAGLVLRREIDEVFDSALQEVAQRVLPLAYSELLAREDGAAPQHMASVGGHREYITYVVRDGDGRVLLRSSDAELMDIPPGLTPGFRTTARLRTYTEAAVRGTIVVTTAEDLGHRAAAVRRAVMALIWPLVALVPIALVGVWLTVRLSLRPVLAFRHAIAARGRGTGARPRLSGPRGGRRLLRHGAVSGPDPDGKLNARPGPVQAAVRWGREGASVSTCREAPMKTRTLIGTALLLSTTGLGVAWAATQLDHLDPSHLDRSVPARHERQEAAATDHPLRFAEDDRGRGDRHHGRRHHADDDDDEDDDDDDAAGPRRGTVPQTGPADPNAPVPDNGLFQGKARPKVEVQ